MNPTTWKPDADDPVRACPISAVVDLVFSRWTTPILWALNEYGVQRFVELERRLGTITSKVLTQRLRQLERDGLVRRQYHLEVPPRVEYAATPLGESLRPVITAIGDWGRTHADKITTAPKGKPGNSAGRSPGERAKQGYISPRRSSTD